MRRLQALLQGVSEAEIRFLEPLCAHTTFRIGGKADALVFPYTKECLLRLVQAAQEEGIPFRVFGGMSNVLFDDAGYRGLILSTKRIGLCTKTEDRLVCDCGVMLSAVARCAMGMGLAGIESLCGIPGTMGGALVMNAGAYGTEIGDLVHTVLCYRYVDGKTCTLTAEECEFGYRTSVFQNRALLCLSATLRLREGDPVEIAARMATVRARRVATQPCHAPNAGSVYRQPMPGLSAGALIAQVGLAGMQIGGAMISRRHAGFIVNTGGATATDVQALMAHTIACVREQTGYTLEPEVEYVPQTE